MGTRADFYVGKGTSAEWLGSIAWDGCPSGLPPKLLLSTTVEQWRRRVAKMAARRDDWTAPEMGWPWPWDDSRLTDCAYTFDLGCVWLAMNSPERWVPAEVAIALELMGAAINGEMWEQWEAMRDKVVGWHDLATFPDMTERKAVTLGARSGIMLFEVKP